MHSLPDKERKRETVESHPEIFRFRAEYLHNTQEEAPHFTKKDKESFYPMHN
jgi:hypothetical protein